MAEDINETVRLLVISRESAVLRPLWSISESNSWQIETAVSPWDAIERVQSGVAPHIFLLDLPRGDGDSLHMLRWLRRLRPDLPIIVVCFLEDAGRKDEAIRLGAQEVLIWPFEKGLLESAIRRHLASPENRHADTASVDVEQVGLESFFVSASRVSQELRTQAELLAEADVPVLILGESGSGKDTIAKLIHKLSIRSGFRFLKVNCADMPPELLEAELFGNERTSSVRTSCTKSGKLQSAHKGTLLLDEIAEMPLRLQAQVMQVLQDKVLVSLDSHQTASVDVRILAATSANVERALAEGKLREDLYYRLSAFTVRVPPLRQRKSEIAVLLQHLMHRLARHYSLPPREFPSAVFAACQHYSWPGNLKELEAFVKRYLMGGDNDLAFNEPLSNQADGMGGASDARKLNVPRMGSVGVGDDRVGPKSLKSLIQTVKSEAERNAIGMALRTTGWNRKAAARLLRVSYRTLLYKIEQYHMSSSEPFLSPLSGEKTAFQSATVKGNGKAS